MHQSSKLAVRDDYRGSSPLLLTILAANIGSIPIGGTPLVVIMLE